jgi:uncharacterized membrane protein
MDGVFRDWFRARHFVFGFIAVMAAYVLYHNERFLIDWTHPVWQHYQSFKWWLLPHGLTGACALILAPLQFSERLRQRFTKLHRIAGRVFVASVFVFAPLGAWIEVINGTGPDSMIVLSVVDAALVMITAGIGFLFALKRMIPQHRQWMTRSYACALVFFEGRFIIGITGWDQPLDYAILEPVLWTCLAFAVLIGDIANQVYELQSARPRPLAATAARAVAAE